MPAKETKKKVQAPKVKVKDLVDVAEGEDPKGGDLPVPLPKLATLPNPLPKPPDRLQMDPTRRMR